MVGSAGRRRDGKHLPAPDQSLYESFSEHELLAWLNGADDARAYELVRQTWRSAAAADFEGWWQRVLHEGIIAGSGATAASTAAPLLLALADAEPHDLRDDEISLVLRPDPCLWDGSYANNAWLQECPKPLSKQVWGNALALHPDEATRLGLTSGDVVTIAANGRSIEVPVLTEPGMAMGVGALTLGGGGRRPARSAMASVPTPIHSGHPGTDGTFRRSRSSRRGAASRSLRLRTSSGRRKTCANSIRCIGSASRCQGQSTRIHPA